MAAGIEISVAVLDTLSFAFLTPLVVGEQRLMDLLVMHEKVTNWLRGVWMGHDYAPFTPATICGVVLGFVYFAVAYFFPGLAGSRAQDGALILSLIYLSPVLIPVAIISTFWFLLWALKKFGRPRGLAVIGAVLFLLGRALTIGAAIL